MRVLKFIFLIFVLTLCGLNITLAQTGQQAQPGKGVIAGRVTAGETPVRDAVVIATYEDLDPRRRGLSQQFPDKFNFRGKTDTDGRYRIVDLKSGIYQVQVFAPVLVNKEKTTEENMSGGLGKRIALADDEVSEDVNFSLVRGGVITGCVTFADGRPVVEESVTLILETKKDMGIVRFSTAEQQSMMTDDRGIYRIYGIPDGRYKVSLGEGSGISANRGKSERHKQIYYPGVTDEAAAQWIEIKNGNEVRDVDIKIGAGEKAYTVAGKVVDADTGDPLSGFAVSLNHLIKNEDGSLSSNTSIWRPTNSKGEFKLEGTVNGSYAVYAHELTDSKQYYSNATRFEVNGTNVDGIEIKVHRGLTIRGSAFLEGAGDPGVTAELSQVMVFASIAKPQKDSDYGGVNSAVARLSDDGSFSFSGLRPGQLRIFARSLTNPANLVFVRTERNGLDITQGFEIKADEPVTNVRVVLVVATGKIHGQVKVEGGVLVKNQEIMIRAVRIIGNDGMRPQINNDSARLDPNGRFLMEGLVAGEYELTLGAKVLPTEKSKIDKDNQADGVDYWTTKQRVTVVNGQATEVTLVIKAN